MAWSVRRQRSWLSLIAIFGAGICLGLVDIDALVTVAPRLTAGAENNRRPNLSVFRRTKNTLWRRRDRDSEIVLLALHEPAAAAADAASSRTESNAFAVEIKPATFPDLRAVSRLLVEEFYGSSLWFPAQCLVELRRLQDNFHSYEEDADLHLMLVATAIEDGSLAGFVDVDGRDRRTSNGGYRPYLSDLAVARRFRRIGIGTELVRACEDACARWGFDNLYLKVNAGNAAAEKLYQNLGYAEHAPKNTNNEVTLRGSLPGRRARATPGSGDEAVKGG